MFRPLHEASSAPAAHSSELPDKSFADEACMNVLSKSQPAGSAFADLKVKVSWYQVPAVFMGIVFGA